jgi:hypothetical protein
MVRKRGASIGRMGYKSLCKAGEEKEMKKKLYRYITEKSNGEFPMTKDRRKFRLPWKVSGKGLDHDFSNTASGKIPLGNK